MTSPELQGWLRDKIFKSTFFVMHCADCQVTWRVQFEGGSLNLPAYLEANPTLLDALCWVCGKPGKRGTL